MAPPLARLPPFARRDPLYGRAREGLMDRRELTIRGIILGIVITAFFTAANVYLGLKVGL